MNPAHSSYVAMTLGGLFFAGLGASLTSKSRASWITLPVSRSRPTAYILSPVSVAVVTQTWLPQTTGLDQPLSWMAVFHLTFWVSDQVVGRPVASAWPSPCGPRNSGQLSAARATTEAARVTNRGSRSGMAADG